MESYKYILLDWDGNLAKTLDIWLEAFKAPLQKRGILQTDKQIGASFGSFSAYMTDLNVSDPEAVYNEADQIAGKLLPDVVLYPNALPVIEELHKAGCKLALITTSPRVNVIHLLQKYDLEKYFDSVITHDDVAHHKPHPEPLETALRNLGGTKDQAIMVGDSDKDLGAAKNFGIDSVLFYPEEHEKFYDIDELKSLDPTYIISDFKQLIEIVNN